MRKLRLLPVLCLTFVFVFSSCVSKKKWTELMSDKDQLDMQLSKTQNQVKSLEGDLATLGDEKDALMSEYKSEKERLNGEISSIKSDLDATKAEVGQLNETISSKEAEMARISTAVKAPFNAFTEKGIQLQEKESSVYLSSTIHFKSGSARLSDDSKAALQSIVDVLTQHPGLQMAVEGHTDDLPMKEGASWSSNNQLSKVRAMNVVKELVKMGIDKSRLSASGHGSSKPGMEYAEGVDINEARNFNRRAEFSIVTPTSSLYQLSKTL